MDDDICFWAVEQAAERAGVPIVATGSPLMHSRWRKRLHDVLTAIRLGQTVDSCGFGLHANAEQYLRGRAVLARQFRAAWMHETVAIARRCTFSLEELILPLTRQFGSGYRAPDIQRSKPALSRQAPCVPSLGPSFRWSSRCCTSPSLFLTQRQRTGMTTRCCELQTPSSTPR